MKALDIISHSEDQTTALAKKLASSFLPGDVLILSGALGSGKTTFARALACARGIDENVVNSPSYTFVNEYGGDPPLYHLDLYRLNDIAELREIGWDEYLSYGGVVMVEWGEKAAEMLPDRYYLIEFKILGETERHICISLVQP